MSRLGRCFLYLEALEVRHDDLCAARVSEALGVKVERPQRREDERP